MRTIKDRINDFLDFSFRRNTYWLIGLVIVIALPVLYAFHNHPLLKSIGDYVLLLTALVVNAFVLTYARRNWRSNPYGRAIMYSQASLATIANLSVITVTFGPNWEYRFVLRLILFVAVLIAQTRMFQLLLSTVDGPDRKEYTDTHDKDTGREI